MSYQLVNPELELAVPLKPELKLVGSDTSREIQGSHFDHEVFHDHDLIESKGIVVGLENQVSGEDAEYMWQMYLRGFSALNASTLSRQSLSEEEFKEELEDESVIKYMARNKEGKLVGYMAVEKGLFLPDASPYWPQQDDDLLSAVQDEVDPNAPSFYISSFLVDKNAEEYMLKTSKIILQGALRHFKEVSVALDAQPVCFYDFAPANSFLPEYITSTGLPEDEFEGVEIDTWPVYVAEWYKVSLDELDEDTLSKVISKLPEESFGDKDGSIEVSRGVPLEIQPENLDGETDEYITIFNLPIGAGVSGQAAKDILGNPSINDSAKYALVNLKRLGSVGEPVEGLGERLSYQSFVAQKLKED
jgi:hypothetical protein